MPESTNRLGEAKLQTTDIQVEPTKANKSVWQGLTLPKSACGRDPVVLSLKNLKVLKKRRNSEH